MIRPKHDLGQFPWARSKFRYVVTPDVVARKSDFFDYAAKHGAWYFSTDDNAYCHITQTPLILIPGAGTTAGNPQPTIAMDHLVIAKADSETHAYADDGTRLSSLIAVGKLQPLLDCEVAGCFNLAVPGQLRCKQHE
ncbi:hypothetical protein Pan181_29340 [Aeoliella mucimassa]|uniref:Uncharacterized protein n=1 Tax=Aeoliella mucimassa TaxID=2527972 RepID=A0A518APS7_9BACT|nr:hypothetical protein Pan181_29340 [Aeoliella mucimassa]